MNSASLCNVTWRAMDLPVGISHSISWFTWESHQMPVLSVLWFHDGRCYTGHCPKHLGTLQETGFQLRWKVDILSHLAIGRNVTLKTKDPVLIKAVWIQIYGCFHANFRINGILILFALKCNVIFPQLWFLEKKLVVTLFFILANFMNFLLISFKTDFLFKLWNFVYYIIVLCNSTMPNLIC